MAKSALIWSAVLAVVGGGVLYLRGRRRWVHVQVSIEVGDLADRCSPGPWLPAAVGGHLKRLPARRRTLP